MIDCFSSAPASLAELFDAIAASSATASDQHSKPVSVLIDDLSALKWQFGADKVVAFMRCCKALTHASNGLANVVVLSHADTEISAATAASSLLSQSASTPSPLKAMVRRVRLLQIAVDETRMERDDRYLLLVLIVATYCLLSYRCPEPSAARSCDRRFLGRSAGEWLQQGRTWHGERSFVCMIHTHTL